MLIVLYIMMPVLYVDCTIYWLCIMFIVLYVDFTLYWLYCTLIVRFANCAVCLYTLDGSLFDNAPFSLYFLTLYFFDCTFFYLQHSYVFSLTICQNLFLLSQNG